MRVMLTYACTQCCSIFAPAIVVLQTEPTGHSKSCKHDNDKLCHSQVQRRAMTVVIISAHAHFGLFKDDFAAIYAAMHYQPRKSAPTHNCYHPSYTHSLISGLKPPSRSANPSHLSLCFRFQDWLHVFPGLLTNTSEHVYFHFLVFGSVQ